MKKKLIYTGAEASIFREGQVILKIRHPKRYRHPELDARLQLQRTKAEAGILQKVAALGIAAPNLILVDKNTIKMHYIAGKPLRECLETYSAKFLGQTLAKLVAKLHALNIVHADLTTSNILIKAKKMYLVDFGLSFATTKNEDKAVDLYVLMQSLSTKHSKHAQNIFSTFLKTYGRYHQAVIERFEVVMQRGRHKRKSI